MHIDKNYTNSVRVIVETPMLSGCNQAVANTSSVTLSWRPAAGAVFYTWSYVSGSRVPVRHQQLSLVCRLIRRTRSMLLFTDVMSLETASPVNLPRVCN